MEDQSITFSDANLYAIPKQPKEYQLFINGEWRDALAGKTFSRVSMALLVR